MDKQAILNHARFYLSKGFSVIPVKLKDKRPALPSWLEYQNRLPTDKELVEWFGNGTEKNIGIVTGKISGIVAVDLDSNRAVEFAKANNFPLSPLSKTGKGYHIVYQYKDGVRNFQKRDDLPDIDLRGEGGYVVVESSIHPSGHQYRWVKGKGLDDIPIAELPEIILVRTPQDKTPLKELYGGVDAGERNDSLARLVGSWVNDGLSFEECLENAFLWNSKNSPPLSEKEVVRTIKSIFERHHREQSNSPDIYSAGLMDYSELEPITFLKRGSDLQMLECNIEWCIEGLLPKQSITLLHGRGGIGKTWLSLVLADAICRGNEFMGLSTQKMPVIFVDFENSLPVLVDRVRKIGIEDVFFWHSTNEIIRPIMLDDKGWKLYKKLPAGSLLIFDTLRASQRQDENDSQNMAFVMSRLKELRNEGFTILLLHHTVKSNDRKYKGSTAIFDLADHILSLHKVKKTNLDSEIDDDEEDSDCLYRFGTKDKTRYEPFHIFMAFDKDRGFLKASDPDDETLQAIHEILEEKGTLNTNQIFEAVKGELDIKSKGKTLRLLKKGEGKFWTSHKTGRAVVYESVQKSSIYIADHRTDKLEQSKSEKTDSLIGSKEPLENTVESNSPDISQTNRTDDRCSYCMLTPSQRTLCEVKRPCPKII